MRYKKISLLVRSQGFKGMDFNHNEEQAMLAEAVGRWLAEDYGFERRRRLAAGQEGSAANWRQLADLGLLGLVIPESQGGIGRNAVDVLIVMQALGRALVVEPYVASAIGSASLIAVAGSPQQCAVHLPAIAAGESRVVIAALERGARYDLEHVTTRAEFRGGDVVISGSKSAVVGADSADQLIVSARTAGHEREQEGISLFLVPAEAAGVERVSFPTIDGLRAADLRLDQVTLPSSALLGPLHGGHGLLEHAIDRSLAAHCAEAVGAMERLLEMTIEQLRSRRQFGQPIGKFQSLQHRVAEMAIAIDQARATMFMAAARIDDAQRLSRRRAVSAAKYICGRSGRFVGEQAVQLHGGMGMTDALDVGWYFKRLVCLDLLYGDAAHHLEMFGAK